MFLHVSHKHCYIFICITIYRYTYMGISRNGGNLKWIVAIEKSTKIDDLRVPLFQETSIYIYIYIYTHIFLYHTMFWKMLIFHNTRPIFVRPWRPCRTSGRSSSPWSWPKWRPLGGDGPLWGENHGVTGYPNGWRVYFMENPIKMDDDWQVPPILGTSICVYIYIHRYLVGGLEHVLLVSVCWE